jgi:hypothetical protein
MRRLPYIDSWWENGRGLTLGYYCPSDLKRGECKYEEFEYEDECRWKKTGSACHSPFATQAALAVFSADVSAKNKEIEDWRGSVG